MTREVLPEIRQKGYYARPGALVSGLDPQLVGLVTQLFQGQNDGQLAVAAQLSELVALQRQTLEAEQARARLARFPSVVEIPRESVRQKLHEIIDTVAMARGCCTSRVWRELYLDLRRLEIVDLYAKKQALRRRYGRWFSLIEIVERSGLLDIVYTTAREPHSLRVRALLRFGLGSRALMLGAPEGSEPHSSADHGDRRWADHLGQLHEHGVRIRLVEVLVP